MTSAPSSNPTRVRLGRRLGRRGRGCQRRRLRRFPDRGQAGRRRGRSQERRWRELPNLWQCLVADVQEAVPDALGTAGMTIYGADAGDHSGVSVSAAGDVNADGYDDLLLGSDAAAAAGNAKSGAGESYVIFGGSSLPTTLDLASLGASQAVAIYGARAGDQSGHSVRTAGDFNGDGFDDLAIGAPLADAASDATDAAGDSYAVFGANSFTSSVTHLGTTGNDYLNGTSSSNVMVGGRGNDTLAGNGGADVLRGGQGDDILAVSDPNFRRVVGGNGFDTLRIDGFSVTTLDLTAVPDTRIQGIEQIDLTGSWGSLMLDPLDVLNISDESNTLLVLRNSYVAIPDLVFWASAGRETVGGRIFDVYITAQRRSKSKCRPASASLSRRGPPWSAKRALPTPSPWFWTCSPPRTSSSTSPAMTRAKRRSVPPA